MLHNGLAFEAHAQNTLLRVSRETGALRGFVMRDLGGLRVHPPTLRASTGVPFAFLPGHCVVSATPQEAAKKLYHTLVHNHLQRLVRVLGLHYSGVGWEIVRTCMGDVVGRDSWLWDVWMGEDAASVPGKCLLRMKIEGLYRNVRPHSLIARCVRWLMTHSQQVVYQPFPNLIQFRTDPDASTERCN
jgi:Ferric iron reductase FhuF-like transporter